MVKKIILRFVAVGIAASIYLSVGMRVFAFTNPIKSPTLESFLKVVLDSVIFLLFPIIVLMLVYSGYLFVQAQGNPSKISEAKKVFLWTLVGGAVILAARTLADAVKSTIESL